MSELKIWRGSSGLPYTYWVVPLGTRLPAIIGNYIFAKRNRSGGWDAVYLGHGNLATETDLTFQSKAALGRARGATHVHVRENPPEDERRIEVADLLDGNPEAYAPTGCHEPPIVLTEPESVGA